MIRNSFLFALIGSSFSQVSLAEHSPEHTNSQAAVHRFFSGTTSLGAQLQYNLPDLNALENGNGFTLDISHEVSRKVFIDLGYLDSGDLDFDPEVSADSSANVQGFLLSLRGYSKPRTHTDLNYYGKLGIFKGEEEIIISNVSEDGNSPTNFLLSFGAEKQIQENHPMSVFGEITYHQDAIREGWMTSFGLGIRWFFEGESK
ncbi:MAG: hypothetical protein V4629_03640 [Pseudomonadota bacterium]